jgi:hypothetical protein
MILSPWSKRHLERGHSLVPYLSTGLFGMVSWLVLVTPFLTMIPSGCTPYGMYQLSVLRTFDHKPKSGLDVGLRNKVAVQTPY